MRSYIFTPKERHVIRNFLNGKLARGDLLLMVILSRVKRFTDLAGDVDLYVRLREAVSASTT